MFFLCALVCTIYFLCCGKSKPPVNRSLVQIPLKIYKPLTAVNKKQPFESKGETECRRVARLLTGKPFPKKRPHFLRNTVTDMNLEIDCFCDELGVGVEYNGKQHYQYVPYFHNSKEAFHNTKYRDEMKKRLCSENNIKLVIVPYTVEINKIHDYVKEKFTELGII